MTGRRLDWRSGGWVLAGAIAIAIGLVAWRAGALFGDSSRAIGDGSNPATYGIELEGADLDPGRLAAAGFPRDGVPALVDPPVLSAREVPGFDAAHRGKFLVPSDLVVGLALDGESRAYPVRMLNWHEIVNDRLGGRAVAVTYHPLCDSAVAFSREVAGRTLEFGVSGLLYDSNLLMYDRVPEGERPSLWSQLRGRAIAGPAARDGLVLEVLPVSLARWSVWLAAHPETTVLEPDPAKLKRYERDPYGNYFLTGHPRFPVEPYPPPGPLRPMDRVLVLDRGDGARTVTALVPGISLGDAAAVDLPFGEPPSVIVDPRHGARSWFARWFAWHAAYPEDLPIPG